MEQNIEKTRCLIIGSGPAGYTAAIYTARANLSPILYEGIVPGGQLTITTHIENYPGHPKMITGVELMELMKEQAQKHGTDVRFGVVTSVDFGSRPFRVVVDGRKEIIADSVIVATGATAKYLGLPSEEKYRGMGVSACATCDGFLFRGKTVAVVGGGDTACEEALYLSGLCKKVYMIVRKDYLRASKTMQQRVMQSENVEILFGYNTQEIIGDENGVTGAILAANDGSQKSLAIDGFFLAIGHHPNTEIFREWIELDETGYIKTLPGTSKTNVEGIFAAGDVQDPDYRQAITAAGSGCMAAIDCERFLMEQE